MHDPEGKYQMRDYHYTCVAVKVGQMATPKTLRTLQERIRSNEPTMNRVSEEIEAHLHELGWVPHSKIVVSPIS
jgi:hypothetical protein